MLNVSFVHSKKVVNFTTRKRNEKLRSKISVQFVILWVFGGSKTRERQLKMYLVGRYCSTKKVAIRVRNTLYSVWKLIIVWCHCHLAERGQITQKYTLQRSNSAGLWETPPAPNLSDNFHAFFHIILFAYFFVSWAIEFFKYGVQT